jgi:hypothetical protein
LPHFIDIGNSDMMSITLGFARQAPYRGAV